MIQSASPTPLPATAPDMRRAARSTLLIRSAKLICQSGEYACLVRDVSATGARLRLFHAMPPETHVFLETANGGIYPMEQKWSAGDEAGFAFAAPIDVDAFVEDAGDYPRRPIRLSLECHGRLFADGRPVPVVLRNISRGGALIETTTWLALHQIVRLSCDGLPERLAQVRWRNRYHHGLAFEQAFALDELALHARALQPFAVQSSPAATQLAGRLRAIATG